ncbi:hypothetical protein KIW84_035762 [Lathyrus oleraceus]|uniref:Uncharacterized protein n=1 Tax=Pisum sativum TaxID=3888 RepID=A0A9D4Y2Q8_PEA|nr:hypothetical protein KIW84_035762 [Pisum sativum]
MGTTTFFEDIEFGGKNKVRDIVLEKESVTIPKPIHTVAFDQESMEHKQDIVDFPPTQDDLGLWSPLVDDVKTAHQKNSLVIPIIGDLRSRKETLQIGRSNTCKPSVILNAKLRYASAFILRLNSDMGLRDSSGWYIDS